jgi:hypothetical protein
MPDAISNTSPLLYLHRAGILDWLCEIFERIWVPSAVVREIDTGGVGGHDVPKTGRYAETDDEGLVGIDSQMRERAVLRGSFDPRTLTFSGDAALYPVSCVLAPARTRCWSAGPRRAPRAPPVLVGEPLHQPFGEHAYRCRGAQSDRREASERGTARSAC